MNEENAVRVSEELYRALKAIAEGYPVSVHDDRFIQVQNPNFVEDRGDYTNLVIDIEPLRPATEQAGGEVVALLEWLETEVSAIDTWYRGDPSYEHDAGWMKDEVFGVLKLAAKAFSPPSPAATQSAVVSEAIKHAIDLEQCAIFAADAGPNIAKAMTDAAAFLRALSNPGASQ